MNRYLIAIILMLMIPGVCYSAGWYNGLNIKELRFSQGAANVRLTIKVEGGSGETNPDGCDMSGEFVVPYSVEKEAQETAMLSGILSAFATGNSANAYLNGCVSGIGGKTYPKLHYFFVIKD